MQKESFAKRWFDVTATALVAIAAVAVIARSIITSKATGASRDAVSLIESVQIEVAGSPTLGTKSAAVGLVVFSDFECRFCQDFALSTLPALRRRFIDSGQIRLVFKHFPLVAIHPDARKVSELAACSGSNERFWLAHDWLFQPSTPLSSLRLETLAANVPVNVKEMEECLDRNALMLVDDDIALGTRVGVRSTPEVLVGTISGEMVTATRRLRGAQHIDVFSEVIGAVVAAGR